jgi:hypothetical protein
MSFYQIIIDVDILVFVNVLGVSMLHIGNQQWRVGSCGKDLDALNKYSYV